MMKNLLVSLLLSLTLPSFAQGPGIGRQPHSIQYDSRFTHKPDRLVRLKERVMEDKVNRDHKHNLRSIMVLQPILLYDSIYTWEWNAISSRWVVEYRYVDITYDKHHQLASAIGQQWNGITWENDEMVLFEYDPSGNEITELYKYWEVNTWQNSQMRIKGYNEDHQVTEETLLFGDGDNWNNYWRSFYDYDINGNIVSDLYMRWTTDHWRNQFHDKFEYDEDDKLTLVTRQSWLGDFWIYQNMNRLTYDTNDSLILEVAQKWKMNAWENDAQIVYVYNPDLRSTIQTEQGWNGTAWENRDQNIITYTNTNKLSTLVVSRWNAGLWEYNAQIVNAYDGNNNLIKEEYFEWNEDAWLRQYQYVLTYDEYNFVTATIHKSYGGDGVSITYGDSMVVHFHVITALEDLDSDDSPGSVYPNPSDGMFTIVGDQIGCVNVFNSIGQLVYSIKVDEPQSILPVVLPGFASGLYLVQVSDQGKIITHQVVIR